MKYDKLVRDKIPEIIRENGVMPVTRVVRDTAELRERLQEKLHEEVAEYQHSTFLEELTDILEVVYALAELDGCDRHTLERMRADKEKARGAFKKGIILLEA